MKKKKQCQKSHFTVPLKNMHVCFSIINAYVCYYFYTRAHSKAYVPTYVM